MLQAVSLDLLSLHFLHLRQVLLFNCYEFAHLTLELVCFFDVLDVENVLKVQPGTLEDLPLLNCVRDQNERVVLLLDLLLEALDVARTLDVADAR